MDARKLNARGEGLPPFLSDRSNSEAELREPAAELDVHDPRGWSCFLLNGLESPAQGHLSMLSDPLTVGSLIDCIPVEACPPSDLGDRGELVAQSTAEHDFPEALRNLLSR